MAGVPASTKEEILNQFPFEHGTLPVRYLGLPLMTKRMTSSDYLPLLEKIRSQISSWTARTLSFAGRLQLISSVIFSLTNFWIAAFRLPKACIKEIDKMCSAFLWSGPSLNTRKAKVAWSEVCTPKSEGGLGLRSIEEANKVCVLKLIWRILSAKGSLWVDWVQRYLIRGGSFWAMKDNTSQGSWIWRKMLKYREQAKHFHRVEANNGETTFFWFDSWSSLGCLHDKLGDRGCIDMGIPKQSSLSEAMNRTRRRKHRQELLNLIEDELQKQRQHRVETKPDTALWRGRNDCYRKHFLSRETWSQIRLPKAEMQGHKEIWFSGATPRYAFVTWLVMKNRVATGERMIQWKQNAHTRRSLCNEPLETREHLFFQCPYSKKVWKELLHGILLNKFTDKWMEVIKELESRELCNTKRFILRFVFQNTIHSIWRERNGRRHGEQPSTTEQLVKFIDKNIRNRLSTLRKGGVEKHVGGIQMWFASRQHHG